MEGSDDDILFVFGSGRRRCCVLGVVDSNPLCHASSINIAGGQGWRDMSRVDETGVASWDQGC